MSNTHALVTKLFDDRESAERAYQSLAERGYSQDDINVVISDETRERHFSPIGVQTEFGTKAAEGAGIGGAIGGTLGAIIAAVLAAGSSLVIPGAGLIVAGPLAAALAGGGAGAASGGLVGALVGWGIPEERVTEYEAGIKKGGILLGVRVRDAEDAACFEESWKTQQAEKAAQLAP